MSQIVTLGTQGNQPFEIKSPFVSRTHARVDIHDNTWTLTDLNSANGTFIRDDTDGTFKRVSTVNITPLTYICLGPPNSKGCCFFARQLQAPGNYDAEYAFINGKEDEYEEELKNIETIGKRLTLLKPILMVVLMVLSFVVYKAQGMEAMIIRTVCASIPSAIIQVAYSPSREKKKLNQQYETYRQCPNPACQQRLRTDDIRSYDCPKCHC